MIRLLPLLGLLCSGCALSAGEGLPSKQGCLIASEQAHPVTLEIASSAGERRQGLMGREELAEDSGMLFVYQKERQAEQSFWMYNTLIPLDIAYMAPDGVILAIRQMSPCPADSAGNCPTYPAGVPYYLALEMNQGYFQDHGIGVGDRLTLNPSDC